MCETTVYTVRIYAPPRTRPYLTLDFCSPKHRREWQEWPSKDENYLVCDEKAPAPRECWWCGSVDYP